MCVHRASHLNSLSRVDALLHLELYKSCKHLVHLTNSSSAIGRRKIVGGQTRASLQESRLQWDVVKSAKLTRHSILDSASGCPTKYA